MKYRENMNQDEVDQLIKELNELDFAYKSAAENDAKTVSPVPNNLEDPTDYIGMGWVDSRGRP